MSLSPLLPLPPPDVAVHAAEPYFVRARDADDGERRAHLVERHRVEAVVNLRAWDAQ